MNFSKAVLFAATFAASASAAPSDQNGPASPDSARLAGTSYVGPRNPAAEATDSLPAPMTMTWAESQMTWPADGKKFGSSVAISGATAFVGAPGQDSGKGAVYVMLHNVCTGGVCTWG